MEGFERACKGSQKKILQSLKASAAANMKCSEIKIIAAAKSGNILHYFKANLCVNRNLPLKL